MTRKGGKKMMYVRGVTYPLILLSIIFHKKCISKTCDTSDAAAAPSGSLVSL